MCLRRVLGRRLVEVSVGTEVLRRVLRRGGVIRRRLEGRNTPFLRVVETVILENGVFPPLPS